MASVGTETRVGMFVLAALTLLVGFVLALGDFRFRSGLKLHADFAYAAGLQPGAPVKVGGIRVGRVAFLRLLAPDANPPPASSLDKVGMSGRPVVRAGLVLDPETHAVVTHTARFAVATQGVVGEAYLELEPGVHGESPLEPGTAVRGVDAPRVHMIVLQMGAIIEVLEAVVSTAGQIEEGHLLSAVAELMGSVGELVREKRGVLGDAIDDLAAASEDLRVVLTHARAAMGEDGTALSALVADTAAVAEAARADLPDLLAEARRVLAEVESLRARADKVFADGGLEQLVADARATAASMKELSRDGETLMARIQRGDGSVGGLVKDPQVYDDLKELLRDLKQNPWKVFWRD